MKLKLFNISLLTLILFIISACGNSQPNRSSCSATDHSGHNHGESETHEEKAEKQGESGSEEIIFTPEKTKEFGVETTKINATIFRDVTKVSGEISAAQTDQAIVAAPASGIINLSKSITNGAPISKGAVVASISAKNITGGDLNEAARISYEAAKREYERVIPLYKDRIITEREYNSIKENYEKAKIAYRPSRGSGNVAIAPISGSISQLLVKDGEYVEIGAPIAYIAKNARLTLRADLPENQYSKLSGITTANFRTSYNDEILSLSELNGKRISTGAMANATPGYIPVYFEFDSKGKILSGAYVEIFLIGIERENVITVPIESITEEQGEYFVYVKIDAEGYNKRLVKLGASDGKNIEILSGVNDGDEVVTKNVMMIKLAASSGAVPEGHSHNH